MRRLVGIAVIAALTLSAPPIKAQNADWTIGKVRDYCAEWDTKEFSQVKNPFFAGYCLGLAQAFRDGVTVGMASTLAIFKEKVTYTGPEKRTGFEGWCLPDGVTTRHLAGVFMSWSSGKPEYWHLPYSIGYFQAFRDEWPCPGSDTREQGSPAERTTAPNPGK